jgi:hypothetical protein
VTKLISFKKEDIGNKPVPTFLSNGRSVKAYGKVLVAITFLPTASVVVLASGQRMKCTARIDRAQTTIDRLLQALRSFFQMRPLQRVGLSSMFERFSSYARGVPKDAVIYCSITLNSEADQFDEFAVLDSLEG